MTRARLAASVPLLGVIVVIATVTILSSPGDWIDEPGVVAFAVILLLLLLAPPVLLAIMLFRAEPAGWLWRTAAVAAVLATAGQLTVSAVVLTDDDPQTPILLALYAPTQLAGVLVIMVVGFLISLLVRSRPVSAGPDGGGPSGR